MNDDFIEVLDFVTYKGRNIYSHSPVMKLIVDIGKYGNIPTKDIRGFNNKLLESFPGLKNNTCGLGYEGGFLEKLESGTYLGHVLEHVILEMQAMLGYDVRYGKTRAIEEPSVYCLIYEYKNMVCGLECGKSAVFILNCFLANQGVDVEEILKYLKKISDDTELGPSTSAIVEEAKKRGIPVNRIGNESLVQLGYGKYSRLIEATLTDSTSCISVDISTNKHLTKFILNENGIPVPMGRVVYSEISAVLAARHLGMPVALKPVDGNQGKGVFLDLNSESEIKAAFREASKFSKGIIVEKYIKGKDYRVLVVNNRVSAVAERLPAQVTGDGVHSIKELVDIVNSDPRRGDAHEKPLTKIKLDDIAVHLLKRSKLTPDYIPKAGETIKLRANGNLSTGGTSIDCTDIIHPENAELAVMAANVIGIDVAGIDMVAGDISKPITETGGAIVEVNTAPGIRMHLYPTEGKPRNVASDIVDHLFPSVESCRFPIVSVTGTNGKTTTVRLISHVLTLSGKTVGITSTSGTFIGDKCIAKGDNSGPRSARTLLSNKKIDCAVLETARGGILREGLGYDLADVGIVTNIAEDHLGHDGIETLEDLAFVKSIVTEAVKKDGYAVFNADDEMTPYLMEKTHANIILFSKAPTSNPRFSSADYIKVFADNERIIIQDKGNSIPLINVNEIPITLSGRIECNIMNSLAAVSALYTLKVPLETIREGLKTFCYNDGRFNLYSLNGFKIMLDYGHNLPCYRQVIKACENLGYSRLIGVIGMPGDRSDEAIGAVGKYCSEAFDEIIIKEDSDKRGRKKLEVARIFYNEIVGNGFEKSRIKIIENELDAVKEAVNGAKQDDLIVIFFEEIKPLKQFLTEQGAKPADISNHTM